MVTGICQNPNCPKKGQVIKIQEHHAKGYLPPFEFYTELWCPSCDKKHHIERIKAGDKRFLVPERRKISRKSSDKRDIVKTFMVGINPKVDVFQEIRVDKEGNIKTDKEGNIIKSRFHIYKP